MVQKLFNIVSVTDRHTDRQNFCYPHTDGREFLTLLKFLPFTHYVSSLCSLTPFVKDKNRVLPWLNGIKCFTSVIYEFFKRTDVKKFSRFELWARSYKTFYIYIRNLRKFVISQVVFRITKVF